MPSLFAIRPFVIALLCCLTLSGAVAQSTFTLDDPAVVHRMDNHVDMFIDSARSLTIDDVVKPDFQSRFSPSNANLTFGYLDATIWLKLDVRAANPDLQWLLEIPAPFLEYVDFYQIDRENRWQKTSSGYYRKASEKEVSHTGHLLPLSFGNDAGTTVYIRIAGVSPKTFPLYAIEKEKFIEKTRRNDLGYGIFFGILAVMFVYNLYIFLSIRQKHYLLYSGIIACTFLIFAAISGYGGKFLWPESPILNLISGKFLIEVIIIFITLYTISFLEVRRYSKIVYYLLWSLVPLSCIALVLVAAKWVVSAGNNLVVFSIPIFFAAAIVVRLKGNKAGSYFIAAWFVYLVGALLLTLRNNAIFDYNFWTTHFVEIGAVLGTSIFGLGLSVQYRKLMKEKEAAQEIAFKIQQEATAKLEAKVNERTDQLYKANKELQRTLETNRRQTQIIESKNAELDTFFYRISHDLKGPISSSLGLMVLAKMDVKDELALEYINKQHAQLERLSHIISGLINLTNLNNSDLVKQRIDFDKMIEDCITSLNNFKNFPKLTFEKNIQPDLVFYSEWTLLNAILQNLIENSIKYCRGQSPYVKVTVFNEAEWLVLRVEDNGQGIPSEHHNKIFDMFYRANQEADGTGLGLYILKRSVDLLKGTIEINSQVGVGSTFIVRLPYLTVSQQVPA